jgi:hypothetical protein
MFSLSAVDGRLRGSFGSVGDFEVASFAPTLMCIDIEALWSLWRCVSSLFRYQVWNFTWIWRLIRRSFEVVRSDFGILLCLCRSWHNTRTPMSMCDFHLFVVWLGFEPSLMFLVGGGDGVFPNMRY